MSGIILKLLGKHTTFKVFLILSILMITTGAIILMQIHFN